MRINKRFAILLMSLTLFSVTIYMFFSDPRQQLLRSDMYRQTQLLMQNVTINAAQATLATGQLEMEKRHAEDQNSQRPVCTLAFLKQYAQHHKHYPKMPFSQVGNKTTAPPPGEYDCWFNDSREVTHTEVKKASRCTKNVTSIVLLGDSNGNNYAANLLHVLNNNGWVCSKTKVENAPKFQPDPMYYVRRPYIALADIQYKKRPCHGCSSFIAQCSFGNTRTLHFEYLGFPLFNDSLVTSNRTRSVTYHLNRTFSYDVVSSATQQEFIFNEYLAGRYPDVVIFFTSSHVRYSLNNVLPHAQFCFDTLDRYLPPTSLVILASAMKQQVTKQRFAGNLTGNDVQLLLNDGGYAGAQSRLADPNKRWYAFPNLFDHDLVGATDHMYKDHIHRTPIWYQSIMRFMLQLTCVL